MAREGRLEKEEYICLLTEHTPEDTTFLADLAKKQTQKIYGNHIYVRGLMEVSNICKNDCLYCGIRKSNTKCSRYRLTKQDILSCATEGYDLGFRTFVLQGGEDGFFTDDVLCDIVYSLKMKYPECAITLSLGERSKESYKALRQAGADRYLLRHETATPAHYSKLHPPEMSWEKRMECLEDLRALGYAVGCGFMVGSPFQGIEEIATDLKFIEQFQPDMCGIGPFIPHKDTPFAGCPAGSGEMTCFLLSVIRLICPYVLLPATTALASLQGNGRERGILSGANVIMPNLSPQAVRKKYMLYDNKLSQDTESAQHLQDLKAQMAAIGYEIVTDRGDPKRNENNERKEEKRHDNLLSKIHESRRIYQS